MWYEAMVQGCDHLDHGRWELAEEHLLQAMDLAKSDAERWETLDRLGAVYSETYRYEEAEEAWRKSLAIVKKLYEKDHINIGTAVNNVALLMLETEAIEESEPLFRRVVAIYRKRLGANHSHTEAAVLNLAVCLHRQDRFDEAARWYEEAVRIAKEVHGEDSLNIALNYFHYGLLKKEQGDLASAERMIKKATKLYAVNYGPSHEKVATGWEWLIVVQEEREREAEAEKSHLELLKLRRDQSGSTSQAYASQLNTYGGFLERFEHPDQAKSVYLKALRILVASHKQEREPKEPSWLYEEVAWNYGDSLLRSGDSLPLIGETLTEVGLTKPMVERIVGYLRQNEQAESEIAAPLNRAAVTEETASTTEDAGSLGPAGK